MQLHSSSSLLSAQQTERVIHPSEIKIGDVIGGLRGVYIVLDVRVKQSTIVSTVPIWEVRWCFIPQRTEAVKTTTSIIMFYDNDRVAVLASVEL